MSYVIELRHRKGRKTVYIAAVPVPTDEGDDGVVDYENTLFESFEEASKFPYPTAEVAASVVLGLPRTKNLDYEVVSTHEPTRPK